MDMIVRLLGDAKSFAGAMDSSRKNVGALNRDLDRLIETMEAELAGEKRATAQSQILAAADNGASRQKAEYALQLANEVESHRRVTEAVAEEARQKQQAADRERAWMAESGNRWDRYVQKQIVAARQTAAAQQSSNKGQLALIESTRGLEDAVVGYSNNGLRGMVTATANNVAQVGSLIGGNAALYLGLAGVGALIATSLLPKLAEWADGTKAVREETLRLNDVSQKYHDDEMRRIDERYKANFSRGRETRRVEKMLDGGASAKDLNNEADRLREQIEQDKESRIIERAKQSEITRANPLSNRETNPFEKGKFHASPDEEIRKKQAERWETDRRAFVDSQRREKEAARDQDTRQKLLQKTMNAAGNTSRSEEWFARHEIEEKQREEAKKTADHEAKLAADLAKQKEDFGRRIALKDEERRKKAEADGRKAEINRLESSVANQKKLLGQGPGRGGDDLRAVEANSSESFKRVFEVLAGGGADTVQRKVAENTAMTLKVARDQLAVDQAQLEELKKKQVIRTGSV